MDVKLIVVGGKSAGRQLPISVPRFVIGRAADCHLRPSSPQVGMHHCAIVVEQGRAVIEDLGTPSGTFVNGKQVAGQRELHTGDQLRVGPLEFEVQLTVTVGGKKKSKVQSIQEAAARLAETADRSNEIDVSVWIGDSSADEPIDEILPERRQATANWTNERPADPPAETKPAPPDEAKPATGTSRDAAADVLRQLFGK